MRNVKAGMVLGLLEILAMLQAWRVWTLPFLQSPPDGFSRLIQFITASISIALLVLPVAGIYVVYHRRRWGFLLLAGFPLLAIIFGVTAFPVVSYFYGRDAMLNSLFIAVTNALVCAFAFWLFVSARAGYSRN